MCKQGRKARFHRWLAGTTAEYLECRVLLAAAAVRIEVGGKAYVDDIGRAWSTDTYFSGGTASGSSYSVDGTTNDQLYYTRRWGAFSYNIPLAAGDYTLNLYFAEPTAKGVGHRVFNIAAEGQPLQANFDIFAAVGYRSALAKSFDLTVGDGSLNLQFSALKDSPILSALEILTLAPPTDVPSPPSAFTAVATSMSSARLSWEYDGSPPPASFTIERRAEGDLDFAVIGSTSSRSFDDENLETGASYAYRVRANNAIGASEPSEIVQITTPQLIPANWVHKDIGAVGQQGGFVTTGERSFTVSGSGADIWTNVDAFHFAYQTMTGDGSIVARVDSQTNTNGWAKAGIMIRETESSDSRFVLLALSPSNGISFQWRAATHNSPASTSRSGGPGYWFKLTRTGKKLDGFISTNGGNWTAFGSVSIPMPNSVFVGLAVTAHDNAKLSKASFSQVSFTTSGASSSIWSVGASDVMNRWESENFTYNGKLYVFSGFIDRQLNVTDECDVYDPVTDRWTFLTNVPVGGLTHAAVAVVGDVAYFAGGDIGRFTYGKTPTSTAQVLTFNLTNLSWGTAPALPAPVEAGGLVAIDNVLYYFSGINANVTSNVDNTWALDLNNIAAGWLARAAMPNGRNHMGYVAIDGIAYAVGGQHLYKQTTGNDDDVHAYDPVTNQWTAVTSLPAGRGAIHTATVAANGKIVVVGGQFNGGYDGIYQDRVDVYDPNTRKWSLVGNLPEANEGMAVGFISGKLIVVGGTVDNLGGWSTRQVWITDQLDI